MGSLDNTSPTYLCILSKLYLIDPDNIKKYYITEMDLHFVKNANHESFVTYDHTHYVLIGNPFRWIPQELLILCQTQYYEIGL